MVLPRVAEAKPPAAKEAKQPIGVGAITGPQSAKVRAKLLKVLRDSGSYEVTDVEDVKPGAAAGTYQNMAKGIGADAIVVGTVSKAMTLTLSVYGANGARVDAVQIKGGGSAPKLLKEMENELEISLADPFERSRGEAKPAAAAAPAPAPAPAAPAPKAKDEDDEEDEGPPPKAKAASEPKTKGKGDELEAVDIPATPEEASAAESSASSSDSSSSSSDASERGLRPYEISLGVRGYNRHFSYTGLQQGALVPYELSLAPTIFVAGDVYPGAFSGNGVLSNIGLMGRFEYGIATSTNYQAPAANGTTTNTPLKTSVYEYQIGIRGRLPLGQSELGIFALYGDQTFTLSGDANPLKQPYALVPDVHYNYLRIGLDARVYVSKLLVGAHFSPRFLTSMSELDKAGVWFPGAKGSGVDMGLMLGWRLAPWLTPAAGFDVVRYGFDFNNLPATPPPRVIAGGATDTYISGWLGVLANLDFLGGGASASASTTTSSESSSSSSSAPSDEKSDKGDDDEAPPKKQPAAKKEKPAAAAPPPAKAKKAAPPPAPAPAKKKKAAAPEEEEEEEE
ncbi:MAG TPA: hypothetical protein VMI54_09180 [Polyangiaceae bacterium]|nr:hypothetical protein [Polyangiaceae bacterium]